MCGICGQYNFGSQAPVRREYLDHMTTTLTHRGPDDEGRYIAGSVGLGFRRLSIIDVAGGHQPMSDSDESVWVAFNGEIYNFVELRRELEACGHVFRTRSDTEVIVHGYKEWGDDVFNHLNGMFGVAIWDARQRRLVLARDRFGIKLLYYTVDGDTVSFGSEIRAVLAATNDRPAVDPASIYLFLRYRYTPSPYTLLEGIRKLAPGTMLIFERGSYRLRRWYRSKPAPFTPPKSDEQATEELHELYKSAVRRHLLSDVPVGLLLSGGIDSALLLALMNLYGTSWPTYTVGYGATYADDELSDAAATAGALSSRHTSIQITRSMFDATLAKIVACLEEPVATSSVVPMYFVCELARQNVKVALIGQGPDELFGGYRRHLGVHYGTWWGRLPGWVRGPARAALSSLPRNETLKRGLYSLDIPERIRRYQHVLSILPGDHLERMFHDGIVSRDTGDRIVACWGDLTELMSETDELGGLQFLEVRSTLPDELLMYADKLSMAHSLELRVPYLDKEIVEYVERLPARFKVRTGARKWLHRRVCQTYLRRSVLARPKRGFASNVVDEWFRDAMNSKIASVVKDPQSKIYQYLRPAAVLELFQHHASGRNDNHKILFSLLALEEWLRADAVRPATGRPRTADGPLASFASSRP